MRIRCLLLLVLSGSSLTGCSSIIGGFGHEPGWVKVTSLPEGATVYLDGRKFGKTTCLVMVPQSSRGILTIRLEGHPDRVVHLSKVDTATTAFNAWPISLYPIVVIGLHDGGSWRGDLAAGIGVVMVASLLSWGLDELLGGTHHYPGDMDTIHIQFPKPKPDQ